MHFRHFVHCLHVSQRFKTYEPQPASFGRVKVWLSQFEDELHGSLLSLLDHVKYLTKEDVKKILVDQNSNLLSKLEKDGIPPKKVLYIHVDDVGSSSGLMLNMLRDSARLENKGCRFLHYNEVSKVIDFMNKMEKGAIVYVDDFAGSGKQFTQSQQSLSQYVGSTFSQFLLVPAMCEESLVTIQNLGVEPVVRFIHAKAERPLHPNSSIFPSEIKERLIKLCEEIDRKEGLGFQNMATMYVFYYNAPNTVPRLIRGSRKQDPYVGILPRVRDFI